jgi:hypothetical protein
VPKLGLLERITATEDESNGCWREADDGTGNCTEEDTEGNGGTLGVGESPEE